MVVKNKQVLIERDISEILRNNPTSPDYLIKLLIKKGWNDKEARAAAWTMLDKGKIVPNRYMRLKLVEELFDV